jgi:hypothetical protein
MASGLRCPSSLVVAAAAAAVIQSKVWLNKLILPPQASSPPSPISLWRLSRFAVAVDSVGFVVPPGKSCLDPVPLRADQDPVKVLGCGPSLTELVGALVSTDYPRLHRLRAAFKLKVQVHHNTSSSGDDPTNSPPLGLRHEPHFVPPTTRFQHTLRSHGVDSNDDFVDPTSTDAWHGPPIRLSSPPAKYQLPSGEFVSVAAAVTVAI